MINLETLVEEQLKEPSEDQLLVSATDQYVMVDIALRHICRVVGETIDSYDLISIMYIDYNGKVFRNKTPKVFQTEKPMVEPLDAKYVMKLTLQAK